GTVTLEPYSSLVLIRTSPLTAPVEQPKKAPFVKIVTPNNNETITVPHLNIEVEAKDEDGQIAKVEFFKDSQLVGTVKTAPYIYKVSDLTIGNHKFTAKVYDNDNQTSVSEPVTVKVAIPKEVPTTPSPSDKNPEATAPSTYALYLNT